MIGRVFCQSSSMVSFQGRTDDVLIMIFSFQEWLLFWFKVMMMWLVVWFRGG